MESGYPVWAEEGEVGQSGVSGPDVTWRCQPHLSTIHTFPSINQMMISSPLGHASLLCMYSVRSTHPFTVSPAPLDGLIIFLAHLLISSFSRTLNNVAAALLHQVLAFAASGRCNAICDRCCRFCNAPCSSVFAASALYGVPG